MTDKLRAAALAVLDWLKDKRLDTWQYMDRQFYRDMQQQTESLEAALAEPKQEPVAYIRASKTGNVTACAMTGDFYKLPEKTLLYTAPPRREWVGLTDDEVNLIYAEPQTHVGQYAKAIEAKLKEKNT